MYAWEGEFDIKQHKSHAFSYCPYDVYFTNEYSIINILTGKAKPTLF